MSKLVVHLVTWNGSKYMEFLFDSLRRQTFRDWKLIILDNASSDDTVLKIRHELENVPFEFELIENKENKGFAGGHNQLYEVESRKLKVESNYILLLNQDMYLTPDCLEKLVKFMDENEEASVVSPRLMKWNFGCPSLTKRGWPVGRESSPEFVQASATPPTPSWKEGDIERSFTNQIDTLGLKVLRNRRVIEIGAGQDWVGSFRGAIATRNLSEKINGGKSENGAESPSGDRKDSSLRLGSEFGMNEIEVFGVSGALPVFRRSVIDKVGLFDESFKNYKEDVDLAYRLRSAGYKAFVLLDAVAYHDRSAAGPENLSDTIAITNKKNQSEWVKYNSYKNHLMTLIKNEYWQNYLLDSPWIKWYELKKFVYFLLFEPKVLKGLGEIWKMRKDLKIKRSEIIKKRKVGWREMRKWWR